MKTIEIGTAHYSVVEVEVPVKDKMVSRDEALRYARNSAMGRAAQETEAEATAVIAEQVVEDGGLRCAVLCFSRGS